MQIKIVNVEKFAEILADISKNDYYNLVVCDGGTGAGKSCLTSQLARETSKRHNLPFSYKNNMTYLRSELQKWIDGDGDDREGQLPEFSTILSDEFISLFYKRNWYDDMQISAVELLNKCRDRHLTIFGNIPNFWDLDSGVYPHIKFWIHVRKRGEAWVFSQDQNPFAVDKWRRRENEKIIHKDHAPYRCKNYMFILKWDDWSADEKNEYYEIRNSKRIGTEGQKKHRVTETSRRITRQRNILIKKLIEKGMMQKDIAKLIGVDPSTLCYALD